ncbi:MAG: ABC transporter permease, partial [Dehalococcoidia bacterium]
YGNRTELALSAAEGSPIQGEYMQRYIARRLLLAIPTLWGVATFLFILMRVLPYSAIDIQTAESTADATVREKLEAEYGLDDPILVQYVRYLGQIVRGDFGRSLVSDRTVREELRHRLPVTAELAIIGIIASFFIAVPIGTLSAVKQDTWLDYVTRGSAIALIALPGYGLAIIILVLGSRWFQWAPPTTYTTFTEDPLNNLAIMILPALLLSVGLSGGLMRLTRTQMLEVLRQDYVRTARAKGLRERSVLSRHALKNALIPIITVLGLELPIIVGGTVIIETIWLLPGMGRYLVDSVNRLDYTVVQSVNLIAATVVIFSSILVDVMYAVVDPRIRYK